jgi:hypothetical protein
MTEELRFLELAAKYPMKYRKLPDSVKQEYMKLGGLNADGIHKEDSEDTPHNDQES